MYYRYGESWLTFLNAATDLYYSPLLTQHSASNCYKGTDDDIIRACSQLPNKVNVFVILDQRLEMVQDSGQSPGVTQRVCPESRTALFENTYFTFFQN